MTTLGPSVELPISIPDGSTATWRGVTDDLLQSPDWRMLAPPPIEYRWPDVFAWTGEELIVWGGEQAGGGGSFHDGAAYDPTTDEWRILPPAPTELTRDVTYVWTGNELVVWGSRRRAIAYEPEPDQWRQIPQWPLTGGLYTRAVWTGEEIIDIRADLRIDPATGDTEPIAAGPDFVPASRASAVWTGSEVVVVTGEGVYDPVSDSWAAIPGSGLSDNATIGTVADGEVVAVDYEMSSSRYDPVTNTWRQLPDLPLRFYECFPRSTTIGQTVVAQLCSGMAVLTDSDTWVPVGYPSLSDPSYLAAAEDELFAWGADGLAVLENTGILEGGTPRRLSVGIDVLDLAAGWTLNEVDSSASSVLDLAGTVELWLRTEEGGECRVTATHSSAEAEIGRYARTHSRTTRVWPYVGGSPHRVLETDSGSLDEFHHLTWPAGASDVVDVACSEPDLTETLATRIWNPWDSLGRHSLELPEGEAEESVQVWAEDPTNHSFDVEISMPVGADIEVTFLTSNGAILDVYDPSGAANNCEEASGRLNCVVPFPILGAQEPGAWTATVTKTSAPRADVSLAIDWIPREG